MPDAADPGASGSAVRAAVFGLLAAVVGALGFVLLGGVALVTAGLIGWAAAVGWGTAMAVREGGRAALDRQIRIALSIGLAVIAVGLGQIGLWLYGRSEGGVLPFVDHLAQVFGILVPLEFVVAVALAWRRAR